MALLGAAAQEERREAIGDALSVTTVSVQQGRKLEHDALPEWTPMFRADSVPSNQWSKLKAKPPSFALIEDFASDGLIPAWLISRECCDERINFLWAMYIEQLGIAPCRFLSSANGCVRIVGVHTDGIPWCHAARFHGLPAYTLPLILDDVGVLKPQRTMCSGRVHYKAGHVLWSSPNITLAWWYAPGVDLAHACGLPDASGMILQVVASFVDAPTRTTHTPAASDVACRVTQLFFKLSSLDKFTGYYMLPFVPSGRFLLPVCI